jgi:predicted RNA methylase
MTESLTDLCKRLEHFETPEWAARAILNREILTHYVMDPCFGAGELASLVEELGHETFTVDIHQWGARELDYLGDFLDMDQLQPPSTFDGDFTVFMNPPFSLATQFVEKAFQLGARKIVCFQRFAWWESQKRKEFWQKYPPSRVYICGERADCWRHDIPQDQRGSSSPTAHAWFIWEQGHPPGTILGHIYKEDAA